jgi:hypothetical protein
MLRYLMSSVAKCWERSDVMSKWVVVVGLPIKKNWSKEARTAKDFAELDGSLIGTAVVGAEYDNRSDAREKAKKLRADNKFWNFVVKKLNE